ncbi:zinc ribbon domain-containing protein [Oscillibacter sp.]|uniref:zinc ribbon domain-containing protein n=1 Tax=Oscillibacter sp. TaxID=1945593 RepID=UPI002899E1FF|nr:zinc ribbon domain-containing protein [Oscillibacter sp.]
MKHSPGLLICEECGAVYWRIARPSGEIMWRCSSKVKYGKRICQHAPSILDDDVKQAICEILDMPEFDPQAVKKHLECVRISPDGSLTPEFIQRKYMKMIL